MTHQQEEVEMAYREDADLAFLAKCNDEELDTLVAILTTDKNGEIRYTESLTNKDTYKSFHPKHSKYWQEIAEELQTYGANTLASMFRGGKGVAYEKVLAAVCKKIKVNHPKNASVESMERNLLMKLFEDSVERMSTDELKALTEELDIKTKDFTAHAVTAAIQTLIRTNGLLYYKLALIIANSVAKAVIGRGLTLVGNQAIVRSISKFAGPIGWALTAAWTITDIAGPAYRVTIPAVVQVACLRAKQQSDS